MITENATTYCPDLQFGIRQQVFAQSLIRSLRSAIANRRGFGAGTRLAVAATHVLALGMAVNVSATPPTFTQEPAAQSLLVGQNGSFTTAATSGEPVVYQWRLNSADLPGQTNATLGLFCVSLAQSGQVYTVMASNSGGAVISGPALLRVQLPLGETAPYSWGGDPNGILQAFDPGSFRGSTGSVYQVYLTDTNLGGLWGTDIYTDDSSIASAAVHTGLLQRGERATLRVRISGPQTGFIGSIRNGVTSSTYGAWPGSYQLLGVVPTITHHPVSQARMVGGTAQFEVSATGSGALQYQWFFNGNPLAGETRAALTVPVVSEANAGSYVCEITDANGIATSVHAVLGVLPYTTGAPQTSSFSPYSLSVGSMARVVVTGATNGGGLYGTGIYQNDSNLSRAAVHAGLLADGETGVVAVVRMPNQPSFRAELANGVLSSSYAAGPAFAFLGRVPYITDNPLSAALLSGNSAQLTFSASNPASYSIQWRKNGMNLVGQTGPALIVSAESPGTISSYDALLSVPGNPTVTEAAYVVTPDVAAGHVYSASDPNQASQYLGTASNLVYVTVVGSTNGGGVWGTGVYTTDSNLPKVAVHAGLLSPGQVGQIALYTLGPWPSFLGSSRNGVTTVSYGPFPGMLTLSAGASSSPQARLSMTFPGDLFISDISGHVCQIWVSPSALPGTWTVVDTINVTTSPQLWLDPATPTPERRFYRVVVP